MEVDSGAVCSVINDRTMRKLLISKRALRPSSLHLRAYNNKELRVLGELTATVEFRGQEHRLRLVVVKRASIGLIGRDWFKSLGISLSGVHSVYEPSRTGSKGTTALLKKYSSVFEPGLGTSKGPPVRIEVNPAAPPRFLKPWQVPFALRPKVDEALDRLVSQGIFQTVRHSKWATPVVPVVKKDGSIRICGDYKSTVNRVAQWETYPLPTPEQLFARLAGCSKFSRLDLGQAYQQKTVDEETADLLTVTTHRGLFRVTRLQFGVAVAVAIFQRYMEELLHGIDGGLVFLDDILIGGRDEAQHHARLQEVLKRIHEDGVQPTEDKVRAIHEAPEPTCKKELQAFLGALNFYNKFLKVAAHALEPLYRLLDKGREWRWTGAEADAFRQAKDLLQSSHVLVYYDVNRPLVLACDAFPCGLGAVLSHVGEDGSERPVAYASRIMSAAERNYAQIDREALAIGFGIKKYHQFLYGRHFKIVTDHKLLLGLLHHAKPIPQVLSPRMLRWTLMLSAYDYEIEYRPAEKLSNADAFSRLPLRASKAEEEEQRLWEVGMLEMAPEVTWNSRKMASFTSRDKLLARVCNWVQHGWPEGKLPEEFAAFVIRKHELSVYQGCLLWGSRVVIPEPARPYVMDILHTAHPGIVKMKGLARGAVWWPGIDRDVEQKVRDCARCQESRSAPAAAKIHPWVFTKRPWTRLHIDFAGPFQGNVFLIVVDSHSKWLEVCRMTSMSAAAVCAKLRFLFATHGIRETVVSDNGTAFFSEEFRDFMCRNQIRHVTVAPYHPSSYGQAERMVRETKEVLKRMVGGNIDTRLARFLMTQHILPHATTGKSPAESLMGRKLSTVLERLHPDLQSSVLQKQEQVMQRRNQAVRLFEVGDRVFVRNYLYGPKWHCGFCHWTSVVLGRHQGWTSVETAC
nr:uncharacterized protein K02A2.6-like [Dermacentor andersoni]